MASVLLVERFQAKMHREGLAVNSSSKASQCVPFPDFIIKKSQYRIQMVRPIRQTKIPALPFGRTEAIIAPGKEFPVKGEDFVYQIWRKRGCCAL
jgi:conjugal transfer pilus assembly protein TraU